MLPLLSIRFLDLFYRPPFFRASIPLVGASFTRDSY